MLLHCLFDALSDFSHHVESPGKKIVWLLKLLFTPHLLRRFATLGSLGYLNETGWVRSVKESRVIDCAGLPIPWATYPYIDFVVGRLHHSLCVFEFGAGASSLFYAARVRLVTTVEHDKAFAELLAPKLPSNVHLIVSNGSVSSYLSAVECCPLPDLIAVDGLFRGECISAAIKYLSPQGVIVLDDSEREEYALSVQELVRTGFRDLPFWGIAAGGTYKKCTSIFYRERNVLGI